MATGRIQDVLSRLEGVRQTGEHQHEAKCPAHEDRHPSLAIGLGDDGRVLLRCQAGCEFEAIVAALGMEPCDLFADNGQQSGNAQARQSDNGAMRDWPALAARYERDIDPAKRDDKIPLDEQVVCAC